MKFLALLLGLLIFAPLANAQLPGLSGRPTYVYNNSTQSGTSSFTVTFEATATTGFKVAEICWSLPPATAAGAATFALFRTSTASSGGSIITNNNTGAGGVGSMANLDTVDVPWPGIARFNAGVVGTNIGIMDQWTVLVHTIASGLPSVFGCRTWGQNGDKMLTIPAGVGNGVQLTFPAAGAGAVATSSVRIVFIRE